MSQRQIEAVLFDLDGTLVDSNEFHVQAWIEAFEAAGITVAADTVRAQIGKGTDQLVPTLAPHASEKLIEKLGTAHGSIFQFRYLDRVRPFPHARDLVRHVHGTGRKLVLASSASRAEVEYYATLLDVQDVVAATTSIDDVENSKPAPDVFATALKKLEGLQPNQAIALGDAPYDAEAAGRCGIATVCVRSGSFDDAWLRKAGAIAIYDDVAALLAGFDASPLAR